jgi:hypothetical protein
MAYFILMVSRSIVRTASRTDWLCNTRVLQRADGRLLADFHRGSNLVLGSNVLAVGIRRGQSGRPDPGRGLIYTALAARRWRLPSMKLVAPRTHRFGWS